jgi:calcineurin-like phosphoesterase family protein
LHLFHDGIIGHCPDTRPFSTASQMNDAIVASWRATVQPNDDVWVVGDFAHRWPDERLLRRVFDALPGKKNLVVGNHDDATVQTLPWASVQDRVQTVIDGTRVVMDHYAMRVWPGQRKGTVMLFGHSHGRLPGNTMSCDVGVDVFGLAPVRLAVVKAHLATLPEFEHPELSNDIGGLKP